jgi:O-antigen/teichoic acid export membrane protein
MTTEVLKLTRDGQERSLTWRASLNLVQSFLDYGAKLGVGLIVIPILVSGLGRNLFGIWEILARLMGYLESTDGRPTQALRLVISNSQSQNDWAEKRRWVGSAVAVWLCCLPLWIGAGTLLIWFVPAITKVPAELRQTVRLACGVMMLGVLTAGLASLPESVLRGMNLGYKRMGFQASLSVVGGLLLAGAVYAGTGLIGVATAGALMTTLTGFCFLILVRRQVPWYGVDRPRPQEVRSLLGMSLWIAAGDVVAKLLLASDVIVLGMVLSASTVTTYVLTGYAPLLAANLYALAADSAMPGLAGIIGEKNYPRAALLRRELLTVTVLFATAVGSTILLWNRSFVHLWVGGDNYAGPWTNLLLVLIAVQTTFIRCDAYLIDAALQPGSRVRAGAIAAAIALILSVVLTRYAGMTGLCLGILAGRATQTIWYPILVKRCLRNTPELSSRWLLRPLAVMSLAFMTSALLGQRLLVRSWATWPPVVVLTVSLALAISFRWGLPPEARASIAGRVATLSRRLGWGDFGPGAP